MVNTQPHTEQPSAELIIPESLSFLAPAVIDDLVRVGKLQDGGYAVPRRVLERAEFLISMGVNEDWSFEEHFRQLNPDVHIHAYDHTVSRAVLAGRLQRTILKACVGKSSIAELKKRRHLVRSYDAFFTGPVKHFENRIYNRIDLPYDVTLDTVFDRAQSDRIFLKVDIEGGEYRIVDDIVRFAHRIIGMVFEFHDTEPLRPVFATTITKLLQSFEIVHLHANNFVGIGADNLPDVVEISFIHKAIFQGDQRRTALPIAAIDYPNNPGKPDYRILFSTAQ